MTLEEIVEEFIGRQRQGQAPSVRDYAQRYPEIAEEILATLPALELVEQLKPSSDSGDAPPLGAPATPARVGDYRIVDEIGRGGMGIIYRAEQVSLGRRVALKILPPQVAGNARAIERFQREARAAARMHHTNIVPVFDVANDGDLFFFAMQLIDGCSLDHVIEGVKQFRRPAAEEPALESASGAEGALADADRLSGSDPSSTGRILARALMRDEFTAEKLMDSQVNSPPPAGEKNDQARSQYDTKMRPSPQGSTSGEFDHRGQYYRSVARIGLQVADALAYAHSRGIIHRDMKPSNLILDAAGVVWISDFGLAKTHEGDLTQTGDYVGTMRYMSPERFQGRCDELADIYGLGLTLYELLALQPAFSSADRLQLIEDIRNRLPAPLTGFDHRIPIDLETIVLKAMEKESSRRYASAAALADDLQRFLADEPILARRTSIVERLFRWGRHNRGLAAALAAVTCLVSFLAVAAPIALVRESYLRESAQQARDLADRRSDEIRSNLYFAEMNLAAQAIREPGGIRTIQDIVARWVPQPGEFDLRGWEWRYLFARCHRERMTLAAHEGWCWSVAWHPDGSQVATCGQGDAIRCWDASSGRRLREITATHGTRRVEWSPDGTKWVTCGARGEVLVWNAESGQQIRSLAGHGADEVVFDVQWNPQGTHVASASGDGSVKIWDVATGQEACLLAGHTDVARCVTWSPDGSMLMSGSHDGTISLWNTETGALIRDHESAHDDAVLAVAWSPDGTRIVSGSQNQQLRIWDAASGRLLHNILTAPGAVLFVSWHPDSRSFASAHWDRAIRLWDANSGKQKQILEGHGGEIRTVRWSPDGTELASASLDHTIRLWSMGAADQNRTIWDDSGKWVNACEWHPDGHVVAWANLAGDVRCWHAEGDTIQNVGRHERASNMSAEVKTVRWGPDGEVLATGGDDGTLRLWKLSDPQHAKILGRHEEGMIRSLCWSPDGKWIATGGSDSRLHIWDVAAQTRLVIRQHEQEIGAVAWSPNGSFLASSDLVGTVHIWQVEDRGGIVLKRLATLHENDRAVNAVRFDPSSQWLAWGGEDRTIRLWSIATQSHHLAIEGSTGGVTSLDWSPDGARIVSGTDNGTIRLWDARTGRATLSVARHREGVNSVAWCRGGNRIVSAGRDGTIRILDATMGEKAE